MKKKLFAMAATVATMTLGMSFNSFAYYVAPPNNDPGSYEFAVWESEESSRWHNGLIEKYAEDLKKIEDPVERFKGCVKSVAEYAEPWLGTVETIEEQHEVWREYESGKFNPSTYVLLVHELATAVDLKVELVSGVDYYGTFRPLITLSVDNVKYWSDPFNYDGTKDESNVCSTSQFSWFTTNEQLETKTADLTEEELYAAPFWGGEIVESHYSEDLKTSWMK
ncbi:MAG: hypothetical protein ACLUFH_02060 [Monoglobales bacterium]